MNISFLCTVLIALLLLGVYLHKNIKDGISVEQFSQDNVALRTDKVFKKNFDLDYYDIRDPGQIDQMKKMFSNQLAPIIDTSIGKENKGYAEVKDVPGDLTNRIPDDNSDDENYKIPLPKFDDLQKNVISPLLKSFSELQDKKVDELKNAKKFPDIKIPKKNLPDEDSVEEEYSKPKKNKNKKNKKKPIIDRDINDIEEESMEEEIEINLNNKKMEKQKIKNKSLNFKDKCKFIHSKNGIKCNNEYPVYTGANFASAGNSLSCNDDNIDVKRAQALAIIKNGSIVEIKITEPGSYYSKIPKVYVRGLGKNAVLKAELSDDKVININVINGGNNYNSTPTIIIEKPNPKISCDLCCKE